MNEIEDKGQRFRQYFKKLPASIIVHDAVSGAILDANEHALTIHGVESFEQLRSADLWNQPAPYSEDDALKKIHDAAVFGRQRFAWKKLTPNLTIKWETITLEPTIVDGKLCVIGVSSEITGLQHYLAQLSKLAFYDDLTGLPSRSLIEEIIRDSVVGSGVNILPVAIIYVDIDNFKMINEVGGHEAGNNILKEVAVRFQNAVLSSDTVGRFGGDEFVFILKQKELANPLNSFYSVLKKSLEAPFSINGMEIFLTASYGVTFFPQDIKPDAEQLLRQADRAMCIAKQRGGNQIAFFDEGLEKAQMERNTRLKEIYSAFLNDELELHYQPQVDVSSGKIIACEALVRWRHPEKGLLYPKNFIDLFADSEPLALRLNEWVLAQAVGDLSCLKCIDSELRMSINIIIPSLEQTRRQFLECLKSVLADYPSVSPGHLTLEVVENMFINDLLQATETVVAAQALGVRISMDDFGTGYSSLSNLKSLSFDEIKIDRGFVGGMLHDRNDMVIVQTVISLARSFGVPVVAEGVELGKQVEVLRQLGCSRVQGFGVSRPMTLGNLENWLLEWKPRADWQKFVALNSGC